MGGVGEGRGCWCRLSFPTCSAPEQATQSVQSQAPASVWSEGEGPPDGQARSPLDPAAVETTSHPIC